MQTVYVKYKCERCNLEVVKETGKGTLGLIRKPKYPDGWQTIYPFNQEEIRVCPNCYSEYEQTFSNMWREYMRKVEKA